jgi:hypothetical protein
MNKIYTPKAFEKLELGWTIIRDNLGTSSVEFPQLILNIIAIGEDPYPLRHGQVLVSFKWQGSRDKPDEYGWYAARVSIDVSRGDAASMAISLGSDIACFLIKRFGFADMYQLPDFVAHWNTYGGGEGGLYGLSPRPLAHAALEGLLGLPRMIFDPRIDRYVEVHGSKPPEFGGWHDDNRAYGPEDGTKYRDIVGYVYALDGPSAQDELLPVMADLSAYRMERWLAAGMPVISRAQRNPGSWYYIPDPLNDWAILEIVPDTLDPDMFIHPRPNPPHVDHWHRLRVV